MKSRAATPVSSGSRSSSRTGTAPVARRWAQTTIVAQQTSLSDPEEDDQDLQRVYHNMFLKDRGPGKRQIKPKRFEEVQAALRELGGDGSEDARGSSPLSLQRKRKQSLSESSSANFTDATSEGESSSGGGDRSSVAADTSDVDSSDSDQSDAESQKLNKSRADSSRKQAIDSPATLIAKLQEFPNRWEEWKHQQPEICSVCLEDVVDHDDALVFCEGPDCDVCVHQKCYGITKLPSRREPWFCDRCKAPDKELVFCVLCPNRGGALKQLGDYQEPTFAHVVCCLWHPDVTVGELDTFTDVDLSKLTLKHWNTACTLCTDPKNAQIGACIGCDAGGCRQTFHVTCGHSFDLLEYDPDPTLEDHPHFVYCKRHCSRVDPREHPWAKWSQKGLQLRTKELQAIREVLEVLRVYPEIRPIRNGETQGKEEAGQVLTTASILEYESRLQKENYYSTVHRIGREAFRLEYCARLNQSTADQLDVECAQLRQKLDRERQEHEQTQKHLDELTHILGQLQHIRTLPWDTILQRTPIFAEPDPVHFFLRLAPARGPKPKRLLQAMPVCHTCRKFHRDTSERDDDSTDDQERKALQRISDKLLQCFECQQHFHAGCLDPPLTKIPPKGFVWRCEHCDESSDDGDANAYSTTDTAIVAAETLGKGKRRRISSAKVEPNAYNLNDISTVSSARRVSRRQKRPKEI